MITLNSVSGIIKVPEMPIGTRFKINGWAPEEELNSNIEFEVAEALPDETGEVPCHCENHQCAFDCLCETTIDCCCTAGERKDNKNVRYIEFIDGQEYHW